VLDCKIRLTSKQPEHSTPIPAASKARIEIETTVNQPYGYVDVLTVPSQHKGGWCESGVVSEGVGNAYPFARTRFRNASIRAVADFARSLGNKVKPCGAPG